MTKGKCYMCGKQAILRPLFLDYQDAVIYICADCEDSLLHEVDSLGVVT